MTKLRKEDLKELERYERKQAEQLRKSLQHGLCKRATVVSVSDVPPKLPFSKWATLVEKVYRLPKGKGLCLPTMHDKGMCIRRVFSIQARGRSVGKPVTCRVRFTDTNRVRGWRIFVFRRSDLTKKRTGKETR